MTILFDLTALYDHLTGIERYAMNIAKRIVINHPENEYILLFKNEVHNSFQDCYGQDNVKTHILPSCHKLVFYQWRLMHFLKQHKADKYVFLSFVSPWLFRSKGIINTIHDISAWDCPGTRKWYMVGYGKLGIKNALSHSESIVAVSEFTKSRLVKRLNADPSRISVIYNGVADQFLNHVDIDENRQKQIKEKYNLPDDFYLCLSTLEPRKNMKLLIEAFFNLKKEGKIKSELVLAGRKGWKLDDVLGYDSDFVNSSIHVTGFIDDEDLPFIYSLATAFVFPSLYEGFGIPIIEAMACNTIVVSSDSSSLPEVVGDAGILFKNNDVRELEKVICEIKDMSEADRQTYIRKGQERIKRFSWDKEAEKYYRIIKS